MRWWLPVECKMHKIIKVEHRDNEQHESPIDLCAINKLGIAYFKAESINNESCIKTSKTTFLIHSVHVQFRSESICSLTKFENIHSDNVGTVWIDTCESGKVEDDLEYSQFILKVYIFFPWRLFFMIVMEVFGMISWENCDCFCPL